MNCCHWLSSCCPQNDSSSEERRPILGEPQSARVFRSPPLFNDPKRGRITVRHVGKPDLDRGFEDFAEMFNKQQENYEKMKDSQKNLMMRYRCSPDGSLSECLKKIEEEHDNYKVTLQMKGYDFTMDVKPDDKMPDKLKQMQEDVKNLCQAIKVIMAVSPKLEEMIRWLLKEDKNLSQQVKQEAMTYQETQRLGANMKWNLQQVSRAKSLSPGYRDEADKLLKEVALLSGNNP